MGISKTAALILIFFPQLVGATILTFEYQGVVNGILGFPSGSDLSAFEQYLGSTIRFSYSFIDDSLLNPDQSTDPDIGVYELLSATVHLDNLIFTGAPGANTCSQSKSDLQLR